MNASMHQNSRTGLVDTDNNLVSKKQTSDATNRDQKKRIRSGIRSKSLILFRCHTCMLNYFRLSYLGLLNSDKASEGPTLIAIRLSKNHYLSKKSSSLHIFKCSMFRFMGLFNVKKGIQWSYTENNSLI